MSVVERFGLQRLRFRFWVLIIGLPVLLLYCSKGKQGTRQQVDPSAPEKIQQLVPKDTRCGVCGGFINQYEWMGQTVYTKSCSGIACDCVTDFYDKNGDNFKMDTASFRSFNSGSKLVKNIWRCN